MTMCIFKDTFDDKYTYYEKMKEIMEDGGNKSTAYKTIYENYNPNDINTWKKGDAIYEISSLGEKLLSGNNSQTYGFYTWLLEDVDTSTLDDKNTLPSINGSHASLIRPILIRGANRIYTTSKGIFNYMGNTYKDSMSNHWIGYRVCLVVD